MWIIDYLTNVAQSFVTVATEMPVFLGVGIVLIILKWRLIGSGMRKAMKNQIAGLTTPAKTVKKTTRLGIGEEDVIVMRNAGKPLRIGLFCLAFFGGGAVFLWFGPLSDPSESTTKLWMSFWICGAFGLLSPLTILQQFNKIELRDDEISSIRLMMPNQTFHLSQLRDVEPVAKSWARGIKLSFGDQSLRIMSTMSGYVEVLEQLSKHDPKLLLISRALRNGMRKRERA